MKRLVARVLLAVTFVLASSSALADLPVALVDEARLPYELSPSNYDNSPSNYDNSVSNYDNSPLPITDGAGVKSFLDARVCGKADVYLCGHDHNDQWLTQRCGVSSGNPGTELIVAGAGASSTTLKTSGSGFNANYFQTEELGFLYVEIVNRTFTGTFVGTDGGVQFTRSFTK